MCLISDDTEPPRNPFTVTPGPNVPASYQTPEECFLHFFNAGLWQFLVDKTNLYATKKIAAMTTRKDSLYKNWQPVTVEEMQGVVAVILNMGIIQLSNLKDYWSTSDTTDLPFFWSVFSRSRFLQIFGALHVGDPDSTLKRDKIQPFLDQLLPTFQSAYTPPREVAIDESVISFRGRVSFRQYLKGKPNPWGIKAFVLAGSKSGYLHNVLVYYGKETMLSRGDMPHTVRVVLTLMEGLHNQGYDLYVDRFYNSPLVATELEKVGITITGMRICTSNHTGLPYPHTQVFHRTFVQAQVYVQG